MEKNHRSAVRMVRHCHTTGCWHHTAFSYHTRKRNKFEVFSLILSHNLFFSTQNIIWPNSDIILCYCIYEEMCIFILEKLHISHWLLQNLKSAFLQLLKDISHYFTTVNQKIVHSINLNQCLLSRILWFSYDAM